MIPIVLDGIEAYAEAHTTAPPDHLRRLAAETERTLDDPQMMVGLLEGRFLEMLVHAARPNLVLEIGTFSGYSTLSMAAALPPRGRIVTCDVDEQSVEVARRYAEEANLADRVEFRIGPALDTIATLDGPFDLVFIDADKGSYRDYYEATLPKLSAAGLIVVDNTLWSGRVLDDAAPDDQEDEEDDDDSRAIRAFNDAVAADERVVCVQLTVRDGVTLVRRR